MCTISSARDSKWSPQPPKRHVLEKKEAAAIPVMVSDCYMDRGRRRKEEAGGRADTGSQTAAVAAGATGSSGAREPEEGPCRQTLTSWLPVDAEKRYEKTGSNSGSNCALVWSSIRAVLVQWFMLWEGKL